MIATAWRELRVPVAGRRRLLDQLILAATSFERALLDLGHESWDELARTVDRRSAELPLGFQRYFVERLNQATFEKHEWVSKHIPVFDVPPAVPPAITEILRAARAQRAGLAFVRTRGKRREDARDNAIKRLAETFHNAAHGRGDYRGRLIDFVRAALTAAKLPVPESDEKVWVLVIPNKLKNPREGPPNWPEAPKLPRPEGESAKMRTPRKRRTS